jgi:hypothetical protein
MPRRDLQAELRHDGRFDVVDIVEANDPKEIERASMIIRATGRSRNRDDVGDGVEGVSGYAVSAIPLPLIFWSRRPFRRLSFTRPYTRDVDESSRLGCAARTGLLMHTRHIAH